MAQNPYSGILAGLQTGLQARGIQMAGERQDFEMEQARLAQEAQAAQQKKQQEIIDRVLAPGGRTPENIFEASILLPEKMRSGLLAGWEALGKDRQQSELSFATQLISGLNSDRPDVAATMLEGRAEAAENSGNAQEAKAYNDLAKLVRADPDAAFLTLSTQLSALPGGKDAISSMLAVREEGRRMKGPEVQFRVLSPEEKKNLKLPENLPLQIGKDGKITAIGGGGTTINMPEVGSIPAGWRVIRDEQGRVSSMEPIPGGPAEVAARTTAAKKAKEGQFTETSGGVVLEDIGRLKKKIEKAPFFDPVVGVTGYLASYIPGTNRVDAESLRETIQANIGFDRLQQMREASPTGGALGQVSDRELSNLQAVMGNLSFSQSEDQLLKNLDRLSSIYEGILKKARAYPNAADFGFAESAEDTGTEPGGVQTITTQEQYDALPSGAEYIHPDGTRRRKK